MSSCVFLSHDELDTVRFPHTVESPQATGEVAKLRGHRAFRPSCLCPAPGNGHVLELPLFGAPQSLSPPCDPWGQQRPRAAPVPQVSSCPPSPKSTRRPRQAREVDVWLRALLWHLVNTAPSRGNAQPLVSSNRSPARALTRKRLTQRPPAPAGRHVDDGRTEFGPPHGDVHYFILCECLKAQLILGSWFHWIQDGTRLATARPGAQPGGQPPRRPSTRSAVSTHTPRTHARASHPALPGGRPAQGVGQLGGRRPGAEPGARPALP